MKIFLTGGTGFLGQYLSGALAGQGHEITLLVRKKSDADRVGPLFRVVTGDPCRRGDWQEACAGHEAVINLTGASIFQRWTRKIKEEIFESRISSTENIVEALGRGQGMVRHLFNASGVGYYGYRSDGVDESGPAGDTFLARVARSWEEKAFRAMDAGIRVILCRFGIVLGRHGGAFPRMRLLVANHLGAPWGNGEQWFSWIHEEDVAAAFSFLIDRQEVSGPVNFTAPNPVRNGEMMEILNKAAGRRPFIPPIPDWLLQGLLGEFSTVFLEGQRALPRLLEESGYSFRYPTLEAAASDLMGPSNEG